MPPLEVSVDKPGSLKQDAQTNECAANHNNADSSGLPFGILVLVGQYQREHAADSQGNTYIHGNLDDNIHHTAEKAIEIQVGVNGGEFQSLPNSGITVSTV